jgi:hypothetical protein
MDAHSFPEEWNGSGVLAAMGIRRKRKRRANTLRTRTIPTGAPADGEKDIQLPGVAVTATAAFGTTDAIHGTAA